MNFLGWRKDKSSAGSAVTAAKTATRSAGLPKTTRDRGNEAEDRALAYLQACGLQPVERNYRTPGRGGGEIDLVMRERDGTLVFVEVRTRSSALFGGAAGSIDYRKRLSGKTRKGEPLAAAGPRQALPGR